MECDINKRATPSPVEYVTERVELRGAAGPVSLERVVEWKQGAQAVNYSLVEGVVAFEAWTQATGYPIQKMPLIERIIAELDNEKERLQEVLKLYHQGSDLETLSPAQQLGAVHASFAREREDTEVWPHLEALQLRVNVKRTEQLERWIALGRFDEVQTALEELTQPNCAHKLGGALEALHTLPRDLWDMEQRRLRWECMLTLGKAYWEATKNNDCEITKEVAGDIIRGAFWNIMSEVWTHAPMKALGMIRRYKEMGDSTAESKHRSSWVGAIKDGVKYFINAKDAHSVTNYLEHLRDHTPYDLGILRCVGQIFEMLNCYTGSPAARKRLDLEVIELYLDILESLEIPFTCGEDFEVFEWIWKCAIITGTAADTLTARFSVFYDQLEERFFKEKLEVNPIMVIILSRVTTPSFIENESIPLEKREHNWREVIKVLEVATKVYARNKEIRLEIEHCLLQLIADCSTHRPEFMMDLKDLMGAVCNDEKIYTIAAKMFDNIRTHPDEDEASQVLFSFAVFLELKLGYGPQVLETLLREVIVDEDEETNTLVLWCIKTYGELASPEKLRAGRELLEAQAQIAENYWEGKLAEAIRALIPAETLS